LLENRRSICMQLSRLKLHEDQQTANDICG
jgi:hypothetical protein